MKIFTLKRLLLSFFLIIGFMFILNHTKAAELPSIIYPVDSTSKLYISPIDNAYSVTWGCCATWNCGSTAIGMDAQSYTNGSENTTAIVASCGSANIAASICYDLSYGGYDDWYLPAKDQIYSMYVQRNIVNKGDYLAEWVNYISAVYWSSTESAATTAWGTQFSRGNQGSYSKAFVQPVRCVRSNPISFSLTYIAGDNGSIVGVSSQTVNSGADGSVVTAVPATGYIFSNWSDLSTINPRIDTGVTGDISVTANFVIDVSTLSPIGNLDIQRILDGEAGLPIGAYNIILNNSIINIVDSINIVSNGDVVIAGATTSISNFTNGDLVGVNLSIPRMIGGKSVVIEKAVRLSSGLRDAPIKITNSVLSGASVSIPDAVTILAPIGWDGTIISPKTGSTLGDVAPLGFLIGRAVDVGSLTEVLLFDKPIQIKLDGVIGDVGYKHTGLITWTKITATCDGTYDAPILSAASFPGECSITNGIDTKILTYHLTTFGELTPVFATLHVIKLVVNGDGGTAASSDFTVHLKNSGVDVSGSPTIGTAAPGISYSLDAGTYVVSEDANTFYTQSFSGDCDSNGSVTLLAGDDKICTIINTNILPPIVVPPTSAGGSYYPAVVVPVIGILTIPNPLALPSGSDLVTYNYTVWNVGKEQSLTDVSVTDDKCNSVILLSGDLDADKKLDPNERWEYSCTVMVSDTTTNTSIAIGYSDDAHHQVAIATAINTVVVNTSVPRPLINIVKLPNRLTPFPFGGGDVIYTYTVANPGAVAIGDVTVIDDKCSPVSIPSGDINGNKLLDPGEVWGYTCQTNVSVSTRSVAMAAGRANGVIAIGYAFVDVLVTVPSLPATGLQSGKSVSVGSSLLNIRELPSLSGLIIGQAPTKTQGVLMDVPAVKKDSYNWVQVGYQNGFTGWSVTAGLSGGDSVLSQLASPAFKIGDKIMTIREMNVRKGASISGSIINSQIKGNLGVIIGGPNQKDGHVWWQIKYGNDLTGWTAEIGLTKAL